MWIVVLSAVVITERMMIRGVEQKTKDKNLANLVGAGFTIIIGAMICAAVSFDLQMAQAYGSYYINDYIELNELFEVGYFDGHVIELSSHGFSCWIMLVFGAGIIAVGIFRIVVVFYRMIIRFSARENISINAVGNHVENKNVGHMDEVEMVEKQQHKQSQRQEKQNVPYWCGKCGFLGPYVDRCPSCDSSIKIFNIRH